MSSRRSGVVLLITMVLSFLVVLGVGGWIGSEQRPMTPPPDTDQTGNGMPFETTVVADVRLFIDGLGGQAQTVEPLPGVRMTVSLVDSQPIVRVCVQVGNPSWKLYDGWYSEKPGSEGETEGRCRNAQKVSPVIVRLVRS